MSTYTFEYDVPPELIDNDGFVAAWRESMPSLWAESLRARLGFVGVGPVTVVEMESHTVTTNRTTGQSVESRRRWFIVEGAALSTLG